MSFQFLILFLFVFFLSTFRLKTKAEIYKLPYNTEAPMDTTWEKWFHFIVLEKLGTSMSIFLKFYYLFYYCKPLNNSIRGIFFLIFFSSFSFKKKIGMHWLPPMRENPADAKKKFWKEVVDPLAP